MSEINKPAPAITVIICMYKGEATVSRMIDCVLNQTFKDFELILVDDGSPDRCGEIADEYAQKDSRVRVLHKPNGGLADARNKALDIATGEYTIQFDQDDWVELNCLEEMYAKAKEDDADMLICDYYYNDDHIQKYVSQPPTSLRHIDVLKDIASVKLFGYCWNKLIRLDVYKKYHVKFPTEFYGCEDQFGMCQILKNEIKVAYIARSYYHYYNTVGSLSRYYDEQTYQNDILARDMFMKLLETTPFGSIVYKSLTNVMVGKAFAFGKDYYSSEEFKNRFGDYYNQVYAKGIRRLLYSLSFKGYYKIARKIYGVLFQFKQWYKELFRS